MKTMLIGAAAMMALSSMAATAQIMINEFEFQQLKGWTLIDVTNVDGDFEGCDYDRRIPLENGLTLRCDSYGYSYAYRPAAVVFAKGTTPGAPLYIKALINDKVYNMQPLHQ